MSHEKKKKEGLLELLNPKQAFVAGTVAGILVLCTIGFFIVLGLYLSDDGSSAAANRQVPAAAGQYGGEEAAPTEISLAPVDLKKDHIRGNKDAKITIVEFSDFECPFCNRFHNTMKEVMTAYPDDVKWVYRHFPLDSLHPNARTFSEASECAAEQGKFWEFSDDIFATYGAGGRLAVSDLSGVARKVGVKNMSKFDTCVSEKKYRDDVQADGVDGQGAGVQGTPFSIIISPDGNMAPINGAQPFGAIQSVVEQMLAE